MSVPSHRALRSSRPRRWRAASAVLAATALTLTTAGLAIADGLSVDGDVFNVSNALAYKLAKDTPQDNLCTDRGAPVAGSIVVDYNGNKHFTPGEPLTVTHGSTPTGVSIAPISGQSAPTDWNGTDDSFTIPFTTTVATYAPDVNQQVAFTVTGNNSHVSASAGSGQFLVFIHCDASSTDPTPPANTTPSVGSLSGPARINEGSPATFTFAITDPDAGDAWQFADLYPDCGPGTASAASITGNAGTFDCTFPDGVDPAVQQTVKVKVVDAANAASNEASTQIYVDNVAPTVSVPAFTSAAVDCRVQATLGGIAFSDPGVNDATWVVSIDWNDGSTPDLINVGGNGTASHTVANQVHTYNAPGTYNPTVTVTDKDGGVGSATVPAGSGLTVNQTYSVAFLPPFDGSTVSHLIVNQMKSGRVVPVKVTIYDKCALSYVTDPTKNVKIATPKLSPTGTLPTDPVETYADAGSSSAGTNLFRWTTDFWIYNLDSKAMGLIVGNLYRVDVYVGTVKATVDTWAELQPVK
jgi:hypothetical protein